MKGGDIMGKERDLIGQKFNRLTVLERAEDHIYPSGKHRKRYKCLCDCGNICYVLANCLTTGLVKSCGCLNDEKRRTPDSRRKDYVGKRFGRLTVIERAPNKFNKDGSQKSAWLCRCDCGNEVVVRQKNLEKGTSRSCGCLISEGCSERFSLKIEGQKFGKLTVMYRVGSKYFNGKPVSSLWHCKCDCGNECNVVGSKLTHNEVSSCGCIVSRGEFAISSYLRDNNIPYKSQYTFQDLKGPNGGILRFDFGILDFAGDLLFLIEYQGEQHYTDCGMFGKSCRATDSTKKEYCLTNNIPLEEIKYDQDTIPELVNTLSKYNIY